MIRIHITNNSHRWKVSSLGTHRIHGPAIEHSDGEWEWCERGYRHRRHGPALSRFGVQSWWWRGDMITSEVEIDFVEELKRFEHNLLEAENG